MELSPNFVFLQQQFPDVAESATLAERQVNMDPRGSCFHARHALERLVIRIFKYDDTLEMPEQQMLSVLMNDTAFRDLLPAPVWHKADFIRNKGNSAVHGRKTPKPATSLELIRELAHIIYWVGRTYVKGGAEKLAGYSYDESVIPTESTGAVPATITELEKLKREYDEADAAKLEEDLKAKQEELAAIKAANETVPETHDWDEAKTRELIIDLELSRAGWPLDQGRDREYEVTGMPNNAGVGYVDYVLWGDDGKPLAVVEAKRTTVDPAHGKHQAKLYADCLEKETGQRPVIFYTNGYKTYLWDDVVYPPRKVSGFYTKDQLQALILRRSTRGDISKLKPSSEIVDRYYHVQAAQSVFENFAAKSRQSLLVMATGSGKTRLSISIVEGLMKSNWVKNVLFLADRNALVNQAHRAYNKHYPDASTTVLNKGNDESARVIFSTYPAMMNAIDEVKGKGEARFSPGHFDLIIIDEAHRSVYQKYRAIFEYFDSLLLGLTATPRDEIDRNTYGLFNLDNHDPTFAYELDQAVNDGFLVPPKAFSVPVKFTREGIKYDELSDIEKEEYEEKFFDEATGQIPDEISSAALNKWLFNTGTVDEVLRYLMENGQRIKGGDQLGKTIIFAKNRKHADFIVERFDANYPHLKGKFCQKIDYSINYAQDLIDSFKVASENPVIAVSVDMLDTGIDVPEILNLVFCKPVRSRTKYWQMIGRGTRLCPGLFGPDEDKKFFLIFDCCENIEFFGENPEGYAGSLQEPLRQRIYKRRLELVREISDQHSSHDDLQPLKTSLVELLHGSAGKLEDENFIVRKHLQFVHKYRQRESWDVITPEKASEIVENLSGLPVPDGDHEAARRFDLLLLNLQLAILQGDPNQKGYIQRLLTLADSLELKKSIPAVNQQLALILEVQTDAFWENITLDMLEDVRNRLRGLIQFIDTKEAQEIIYTNFDDKIGNVGPEISVVRRDPRLKNYRLKMEAYLQEHASHIVVKKLRDNEPLRTDDIPSLEAILFADEAPGSREEFEATYGTDEPLTLLVRKIVGLSQSAAQKAFAEFLEGGHYKATQIEFVNTIVNHLSKNGIVEVEELFELPFKNFNDGGVSGVFPHDEERIRDILETVRDNALA